jgi:hypothetical protein
MQLKGVFPVAAGFSLRQENCTSPAQPEGCGYIFERNSASV